MGQQTDLLAAGNRIHSEEAANGGILARQEALVVVPRNALLLGENGGEDGPADEVAPDHVSGAHIGDQGLL